MTARLVSLSVLLLLAACGGADDGPDGSGGASEVQLVGGQVVCDSCASVRLVLSGPGIVGVTEATLLTSDLARTPLPARIVLDRESGASGEVLVVNAYFDQGVAEGEFDLWLDPATAGDAARVVPGALRVTRARPGPGTLASVRVWVQVTGIDRDTRYTFRTVTGCQPTDCAPMPVEPYTAVAQSLLPGTYTFQLEDVAENCTLEGTPNPATLALQRGTSTSLSYRLTCVPVANPGWVRVANVTTGGDLDDAYQVQCAGIDCRTFTLAANRDTVLRAAPGQVSFGITDVASHCSLAGANSAAVTVTAGDTATVTFAVTCGTLPAVRATIRTTGRQIPEVVSIRVCLDDYNFGTCTERVASSNGTITFPGLRGGQYSVQLIGLTENCASVGPSTVGVAVTNRTEDVSFEIVCRAYGTVRVSAVTSGTNQDLSYQVIRQTNCDDYYYYSYCERKTIASSGSVDFLTAPGPQIFLLADIAPNCYWTAPQNPAVVTVIEDGIVELRYEVACQ